MAPTAFISYSYDSHDHQTWVRRLATDLRNNGVDAVLDQWDLAPGQDIVAFMSNGIVAADRVLLVCTDNYVVRAESGAGGVGYERLVVTGELVQNIDTRKFIPLIRNNAGKRTPNFLGRRLYIDFSNDDDYDARLEQLLRELHGEPAHEKPPLGPSPFSGAPTPPRTGTRAGPSGLTETGDRLLDNPWFIEHADRAREGLKTIRHQGSMELRFGLHDALGKSQVELLNAVRQAEIRTFGWPLGILLENRDEYRPRPVADGIRAEIAIAEPNLSGEKSYDYWAANVNGDFYLLQSLFEDKRSQDKLFFNTRIVRVAEALMFCERFYKQLGATDEARLSLRVSHFGLAGRELSSSTPARHVFPRRAATDESQTEIVTHIGDLIPNLTAHVQQILAPLFIVFDFMEFADEIYSDIVQRFIKGEVS